MSRRQVAPFGKLCFVFAAVLFLTPHLNAVPHAVLQAAQASSAADQVAKAGQSQ